MQGWFPGAAVGCRFLICAHTAHWSELREFPVEQAIKQGLDKSAPSSALCRYTTCHITTYGAIVLSEAALLSLVEEPRHGQYFSESRCGRDYRGSCRVRWARTDSSISNQAEARVSVKNCTPSEQNARRGRAGFAARLVIPVAVNKRVYFAARAKLRYMGS